MVSVVAVASHAGVSPATVSRVLAGRVPVSAETRARVLEAIEQLGYRPNEVARSLRAGRGRSVALVTGDIEQGIYATLAKRVQGELETLGARPRAVQSRPSPGPAAPFPRARA